MMTYIPLLLNLAVIAATRVMTRILSRPMIHAR